MSERVCPHCGAPLEGVSIYDDTICDYCGSEVKGEKREETQTQTQKQTVKLKRPLLVGEELIVSTRAKGERKIQYFRTYDLKINDEVVGGIYSIWTLIDIEKRRIVRPQKVGITIPEC